MYSEQRSEGPQCSRPSGYLPQVPRSINPELLVGSHEIAERLNVKRHQVVHTWRHRHADFPAPIRELRHTLIWYWPDVEKWARRTGRL